jgi:mandelate racemase
MRGARPAMSPPPETTTAPTQRGARSLAGELTVESATVRAVSLPLRRPIVSKVGGYDEWPAILIDLHTREGVVGRSYLEPYLDGAVRSITTLIEHLAAGREGNPIRPLDDFEQAPAPTRVCTLTVM